MGPGMCWGQGYDGGRDVLDWDLLGRAVLRHVLTAPLRDQEGAMLG